MEKFNLSEVTKSCRSFEPQHIVGLLMKDPVIFWSWGAKETTAIHTSKNNCKALTFQVNGFKHQGKVVIVLNGLDLFNVYLVNNDETIKETINDLYFDQLVEAIDRSVEYDKKEGFYSN
jgi:hypothetical protein